MRWLRREFFGMSFLHWGLILAVAIAIAGLYLHSRIAENNRTWIDDHII